MALMPTQRRLFLNLCKLCLVQRFLDDMLKDCHFFQRYPEFKEDYSQVMVLLCDFRERKFQPKTPNPEEKGRELLALNNIEEALVACKTKLNAALARSRIKARVSSFDHLLPASVRQNDKIGSNMHMYCWLNYIKTNMQDVIEQLVAMGFETVDSEAELSGKTYYVDHQCHDMICFPYAEREFLEGHALVTESHLVVQDKSSCVGVHSVHAIMNEDDDVLFVNADSGLSIGHLASLTNRSDSVIFCFGVKSEKHYDTIIRNLDRINVQSRVKLFMEDFLDVPPFDDRLKHVKVVLLVASCSRSGVANPVNFIVSEGEDISILKDLSLGYTDESKLSEMVVKHNSLLKHTLKFPRVQAVVYCTRSLLEAENESVVTRSIEFTNTAFHTKTPYRIAPPVLPLSDRDIENENPLNGKYLRYPPSPFMSGCFVATITREADDPKEAAKNILARAAAKGIFNVDSPSKGEKGKKGKKGKKKKIKEVNSEDVIEEVTNENGAIGVSPKGHCTLTNKAGLNWVNPRDHITLAYQHPGIKVNPNGHCNVTNMNDDTIVNCNQCMPLTSRERPHVSRTLLCKRKRRKSSFNVQRSRQSTSLTTMAIPAHQTFVNHPAPFR